MGDDHHGEKQGTLFANRESVNRKPGDNATCSQDRLAKMRSDNLRKYQDGRVLRKMLRQGLHPPRYAKRYAPLQSMDIGFWYAQCQRCQLRGWENEFVESSPYLVMARLADHILETHALECAFCFLEFESFATLSEHVQLAHVAAIDRRAEPVPDWVYGDNEDMALPQPGGGKRDSERGNTGGRSGRKPPTVPFLKVEDLTSDPQTAKILGVKTGDGTGFNDAIVKIAIRGRSYFFGLKASNENYDKLFAAFGDDENEWVGQEFTVGLNYNEFYEKSFVHVFEAPAGGEAKPRKKSK